MTFKIPILSNTLFDLSKFDFSFLGIKIYDIQSTEFEKFVKKLNPKFYGGNISHFNAVINEIHFDRDRKYAIVKNNYKENYSENEIISVFKLLKIIFPSGLDIAYIVNFQEENNFVQRTSMTTFENKYCPENRYLSCDIDNVKTINKFIKLVFHNQNKNFYISLSIENYLNSFNASHLHFSYIALCISLENLIDGKIELINRLKRLIAIICGNDVESCKLIFKNVNEIYELRSKIVHGDKYSDQKIFEFYEYLQSIVSLTIIEILIHNIIDNVELNSIINTLGYGQRKYISAKWKKFELNIDTENIIKNRKLSIK
jgi:Apea-like HEPN